MRKSELSIIKGILDSSPPESESIDNIERYEWNIENKYYTAKTYFCLLNGNFFPSILDSSEALIIYIDNSQEDALKDTEALLSKLGIKVADIDVKLLVCDDFFHGELGLPKLKAQEWCIQHGWELVELNLSPEELEEMNEDFMDSWGFKRMRQALHAHTWSNMKFKEEKNTSNMMNNHCLSALGNLSLSGAEEIDEFSVENFKYEDMEDYDDEFDALFSSLGKMKERAESLPPDQRKIYAGQIAIAFLKSLGDTEESDEGQSLIDQ
ncbi:Alpha- and gamma-adaptin-binding protein p34 [Armadillidium nasatum]|uniref:Alpha-and gamma-adaptin-binding protein p34 n=1 Tax=Armadillidium nasatum TaxID=96803 RepID=A0A5N5SYY3_9CRUS|nr:Alpha- and gamma-adaptin-binding protein p34 [Armadillidium nasatum]